MVEFKEIFCHDCPTLIPLILLKRWLALSACHFFDSLIPRFSRGQYFAAFQFCVIICKMTCAFRFLYIIIIISISSIVIGLKKLLFSTNSLCQVVIEELVIGQFNKPITFRVVVRCLRLLAFVFLMPKGWFSQAHTHKYKPTYAEVVWCW